MVVLILQTGIITWNWPPDPTQPTATTDAPATKHCNNANANKGGNIFLLNDALKLNFY